MTDVTLPCCGRSSHEGCVCPPMTTTPDTREGLLRQAREIAADWLNVRNPKNISAPAIRRGEADGAAIVQVALAALSTATPPVDGEAKMREALEPVAKFADAFDAKPLRMIDDELYGIHVGTEWEASIRLSDCRRAREALASTQTGGGE